MDTLQPFIKMCSISEILSGVLVCAALHAFLYFGRRFWQHWNPSLYMSSTSVVYVERVKQQLPVQKIQSPASVFDIINVGGKGPDDEQGDGVVELKLKTHTNDCVLKAYWGVSIKDYPWTDSLPHEFSEEHAISQPGAHTIRLNVKTCDLGDQPRTHYHLVTVISSLRSKTSLFTIYHLYGCSIKTSILQQYLKSKDNGSMLPVKTIFDDGRCVICLDQRSTHTLLPCRHACICQGCFEHIDERCPICRVYIESFFVTQ